MTETEKKALALVNEACKSDFKDLGSTYRNNLLDALLRAIEQHEAFRQEVSDAVEDVKSLWDARDWPSNDKFEALSRFIIPKPDPLVEVLLGAWPQYADRMDACNSVANALRSALEARGLEVRKIGEKAGE